MHVGGLSAECRIQLRKTSDSSMALLIPDGSARQCLYTALMCPLEPESAPEAGRLRRQRHFDCTTGGYDVALLDIRPVLPSADRLAPEVVPVVEGRVEGEEDRIVGR